MTQRRQSLRDRGRMVREIVHHQNPCVLALHIHSTLHAAKCFQRLVDLDGVDASSLRNDNGGHGVLHIMLARHRQAQFVQACLTALAAVGEIDNATGVAVDTPISAEPRVCCQVRPRK